MKVISIAAVAKNGAIGINGQLPWHIPEDLTFFKDSTRGQMILMGRKTFESLGKPLPKRINAVLTRDSGFKVPEGVKLFSDIQSALQYFRTTQDQDVKQERDAGKNLFVIGGAQIYEQAMPLVDEVWLTEILEEAKGDTFFPFYKNGKFEKSEFRVARTIPQKDTASQNHYSFVFYERQR